ncbi:ABC transporter substrate-binding protein [Neobittarella massiliensis]|uniref:ABC transporter substrate-binding protein n=1 Tax=Neobittarella massiliensis (ex Bilen et al. 2018) TaxID=2041842 RepID=A0A8J6INN7_9FIRM|nr:ABC transporter substrate-binding protein [Neobittarella massiliensis]MBC3517094.1 ABC transporter substrate-binding protein [Neobittarella massiliensis]
MKLKKIAAAALAAVLALSMAGCAGEDAKQTASSGTADKQKFTLEYPAHMQELGYTDKIELEKAPERIVCTTTYPVMTLYDMDVEMIAVPQTSVLDYPADLEAQQLPSLSMESFNAESIVELEPDLVIMAAASKQDYGDTLSSLGIPVYYMATNSQTYSIYDVVREQSQALVDAFTMDNASAAKAKEVMAQFDDLDKRVEEMQKICAGKSVLMLLAGGPTSMYLQTEKGTLGCMAAMCGLESVYQNDQAASMIPLDMEKALEYDPDVVLITGMGTSEDVETLMKGVYELNPDYWNSIPAIKNGNVIYLPGNYVSTAGINIIQNIEDLADILEDYYAQK